MALDAFSFSVLFLGNLRSFCVLLQNSLFSYDLLCEISTLNGDIEFFWKKLATSGGKDFGHKVLGRNENGAINNRTHENDSPPDERLGREASFGTPACR